MSPAYRLILCFSILLQAFSSTAKQCASDESCAQEAEINSSQGQDVNSLLQHKVVTEEEVQDQRQRQKHAASQWPTATERLPSPTHSANHWPSQFTLDDSVLAEKVLAEGANPEVDAGLLHSEDAVNRVATTASILEGEASTMSSILSGEVSKESIEVVMARYDEDIEWSDPYLHVRTVYCKDQKNMVSGCSALLPNVGREGHTYLYHIVKNYDKLAQWTVFTQAQDPTIGYRGHRLGGGHIMPGTTFDSYVLPESAGGISRREGAAFVITGSLSMDNLNHSLRLGYKQAHQRPALHFGGACPKTALGDGWEPWWDLGWFKKFIGGRCNIEAEKVPQQFQKYWDDYIKLPRPKDNIVFFTQGARFAASRDRILQRPKSYYQTLLDLISSDQDPCWNYFNEWAWFYMIGAPEEAPCDSDLVLQQANLPKTRRHRHKRHQKAGH
mmetsp:Transcript_72589/g.132606  ORF Transcript_72589/g.132606 Transcript_72589/m.132606 type:complete len:442 (-) Transcript_72589:113-1438(-)